MKKLFLFIFLFSFCILARGQYGNTFTRPSSGTPSSTACPFNLFVNDTTNGNIYFCSKGTLYLLNFIGSIGVGLTNSSGILSADCDPMNLTTVCLDDEFQTFGLGSSGYIGNLGWSFVNLVAGTCVITGPAGSWPNLGTVVVTTGATLGDGCYFGLANTGSVGLGDLGDKAPWTSYFEFKFGSASGALYRVGFAQETTAIIPSAGTNWYLRFDPSLGTPDTTIHMCIDVSGTETCVDTLVSPDTNFHKLRIRSIVASTVGLTLDSGTEYTICSGACSINASPGSTTTIAPFFGVASNTGSTAEAITVDFWRFKATGLSF